MATRDDYVFGLVVFYSFLFIFLGFWGGGLQEQTKGVDLLGVNISFDIIQGVSSLPAVLNIFIFGTLSIFIGWILISAIAPSGS